MQHLARMRPSGKFRAGNRVALRVVNVQNDLAALLADEIAECVHLRLRRHDSKVDASALRRNADVSFLHEAHHAAAVISAAVVLAQRIDDIPMIDRPVSARPALVPPGEIQPCAVQQHIARLAPLVRPPEIVERGLVVLLSLLCRRLICAGRKFPHRWCSRAAGFFLPLADLHLHVRAQLVRAVVRSVHAGVGIRDDLFDVGVRVVAVDPGVCVHVALDHLLCDLALAQHPLLDLRRHLRPALDKQVIPLVLRQLEGGILLAVCPDEHGAVLHHGSVRIERLPIDLLRQLPGEEPRVLHAHRPEELCRRLDILASGLLSLRHDAHFLRVVLSKADRRKFYFIPSFCEISRTLRSLSSGVSSLLLRCALANASSLSFGTLTSLPDLSFISNLDTAIVYPFLPCGKARSIGGCRHVLIHSFGVAHRPLLTRAESALLIDLSEALRILLRRHARRVPVQEIRRRLLVVARSPGLRLQILFLLLQRGFIERLLRVRRLPLGVLYRVQLSHVLCPRNWCK